MCALFNLITSDGVLHVLHPTKSISNLPVVVSNDSEVNQIDIKFIDTSVNNSKLIVKDRGTI